VVAVVLLKVIDFARLARLAVVLRWVVAVVYYRWVVAVVFRWVVVVVFRWAVAMVLLRWLQ
jgi:hypothetical protein